MSRTNIAPLNGAFMLTSIIGLFISIFMLAPIAPQWAWAIGFLCVIMFAASLISMTYGPAPDRTFLEKHLVSETPQFKVAEAGKPVTEKPKANKKTSAKAPAKPKSAPKKTADKNVSASTLKRPKAAKKTQGKSAKKPKTTKKVAAPKQKTAAKKVSAKNKKSAKKK